MKVLGILTGGFAAAVIPVWMASPEAAPRLLINETASAPRGLYVRTAAAAGAKVGDRVAIAQPPQARRYLSDLGVPHAQPLLKRVVAAEGSFACARDGRLVWPGGSVTALARDRRGRPLVAWSGCRVLAAGELLVIGDTPHSFDSRYFGPVRVAAVLGVYEEVVGW